MARGAVARRYARALFELARDQGLVDDVRRQTGELAALLEDHRELREVLLQPLHPVGQRRAVLDALATKLAVSPLLRSFLAILVDRRRLVDFEAIREEFGRLADEAAGVRKAQVRTAAPLDDAQRQRLRAALSQRVGAELELEVEEDATLIGGVVAKVGDLVFDGSLKSQLERLRTSLSGS